MEVGTAYFRRIGIDDGRHRRLGHLPLALARALRRAVVVDVLHGDFIYIHNRPLAAVILNLQHLPWLAVGLASLSQIRHRRVQRARHTRPWVIFAVAWSVGVAIASPTERPTMGGCLLLAAWYMPAWVIISWALTPLALAACLIARWRMARTVALVAAAVEVTVTARWIAWWGLYYYADVGWHLVRAGIQPTKWLWLESFIGNRNCVLQMFCTVANAGPWLLIAIYAWRVPMRAIPDDGSPYPRRYSARCYYNLHGINPDRCPECGNELEPLTNAST